MLATSAYESGNYDGQHPFDGYAHDAAGGFEALTRVGQSSFLDLMTPDSLVIIDATDAVVTDVTPGREAIGAFYIGQGVNDRITGRAGDDHIDGFAGNDVLTGGVGNDVIDGGAGRDVAVYTSARGQAAVSVTATGAPFDHTVATPTDGADTLKGIEIIQFTDGRLVYDVTDPSAIVLRLYDAAFDRAPDPTGLHFWTGALTSGQNELPVAALFLSSTEFQVKFGSPDNQTFVQELYQNVLGRAGDTVGLAYWTQTLGTGALTRAGLLVSFAESSEDIAATRAVVEVGLWDPGAPALVA